MVYTLSNMADGKNAQNICIRLHDDEPDKWTEILRRGLQRDPHASKSAIARALFKFAPYDEKLLNEDDRKFFKAKRDDKVDIAGRAVDMPPQLSVSKKGAKLAKRA